MNRRTAALAAALVLLTGCSAGRSTAAAPTTSAAPPTTATSAAPTTTATALTAGPTTSTAPAGTVVEVSYTGGEVSGDTGRVRVRSGEPVTLRVISDVPEQVHVHGVDEYVDLAPGRTATATFPAPAPGLYEVELHDAGVALTRLEVR